MSFKLYSRLMLGAMLTTAAVGATTMGSLMRINRPAVAVVLNYQGQPLATVTSEQDVVNCGLKKGRIDSEGNAYSNLGKLLGQASESGDRFITTSGKTLITLDNTDGNDARVDEGFNVLSAQGHQSSWGKIHGKLSPKEAAAAAYVVNR